MLTIMRVMRLLVALLIAVTLASGAGNPEAYDCVGPGGVGACDSDDSPSLLQLVQGPPDHLGGDEPATHHNNEEDEDTLASAFQELVTDEDDAMAANAGFWMPPVWPEACRGTSKNNFEKLKYCRLAREKEPCVLEGSWNLPTAEQAMTAVEKHNFEHSISRELSASVAVTETTKEFGRRLYHLIVDSGMQFGGKTEAESLTQAFAPKCSPTNTGFAGTDPSTIRNILLVNGNMREIWCLAYCLVGNGGVLTGIFREVTPGFLQGLLGTEAGIRAYKTISVRKVAILKTQEMNSDNQYTWGTPDYVFPNQQSWARFTFAAALPKIAGGENLWIAARNWTGCTQTPLHTGSPSIFPPLSEREKVAECAPGKPPCQLQWTSGASCWGVVDDGNIYAERALKFGYRRVAGPSASTANMLQLALNLGFSSTDMLAFRATMVAWLVSDNDHSFIEVMLGAASLMPAEFGMQWGRKRCDRGRYPDFRRVWPHGYHLTASWGPTLPPPGVKLPPPAWPPV